MILVDLNILLDVLQRRAPRYAHSAKVIDRVARGELQAAVAAHAITTLHYLTGKAAGRAAADTAVNWALEHFEVVPVGAEELRRASALGFRDFEDAVVAAAAERARCTTIVTNNLRDFAGSPVAAVSPEELEIDSLHEDMSGYRAASALRG